MNGKKVKRVKLPYSSISADDPRLRVFIVELALCFLVSPAMTELPREVERDEIADGLAAELILLVH